MSLTQAGLAGSQVVYFLYNASTSLNAYSHISFKIWQMGGEVDIWHVYSDSTMFTRMFWKHLHKHAPSIKSAHCIHFHIYTTTLIIPYHTKIASMKKISKTSPCFWENLTYKITFNSTLLN